MADFLTIAGIIVPVAEGSFKENAPVRGGQEGYSYNGVLRNTTRWSKRSWSFTTGVILQSDGIALKNAVANGIAVPIGGAAGLPTPCRVYVDEGSVITATTIDTNNFLMQYNVTMKEM
jgi:hypothetical protein